MKNRQVGIGIGKNIAHEHVLVSPRPTLVQGGGGLAKCRSTICSALGLHSTSVFCQKSTFTKFVNKMQSVLDKYKIYNRIWKIIHLTFRHQYYYQKKQYNSGHEVGVDWLLLSGPGVTGYQQCTLTLIRQWKGNFAVTRNILQIYNLQ